MVCPNTFSTLATQQIEVQNFTKVEDQFGGFTQTWSAEFTCWGIIRPASGTEAVLHEHLQSTVNAEIIIRYKPELASTLEAAKRRIKFGTRYYKILTIKNLHTIGEPREGKNFQVFACTETTEADAG